MEYGILNKEKQNTPLVYSALLLARFQILYSTFNIPLLRLSNGADDKVHNGGGQANGD